MRRLPLVLSCLAVVLLVASCGSSGGSKKVSGNAVAVVGNKEISKADWNALIDQTRRNYQATKHQFPKPGTVALASLRANAVQFLIQNSEYAQEADKLGVKVSDKDVQDRLDQIKKQYYGNPPGQPAASSKQTEKRYQQALKQQGFTDTEVRTGIKLQLIREKVFQKVTGDVKVSDNEVKAYYDKHKQQYETPAQPESRKVRHILVKKKALADRLYTQLKANPGRFAALARKYSTDTSSKVNGGTLPAPALKGRQVPAFDKAAFSLKTNEISKPVNMGYGWDVLQPLGPIKPGTPAKPTPLSQVKEAIRQQLISQKKNQKMQDWLNGTKKSYCKTISYQRGYSPPPGQDPCKAKATTTGAATTQ